MTPAVAPGRETDAEDAAAKRASHAVSPHSSAKVRRIPSGQMLLAAARIEAESAQAQPLAAAEGRKHAQSITDQVRCQLLASPQEIGAGGELAPTADTEAEFGAWALKNTVGNPDYVAADASRNRLELASRAGVLETALDAADTINAQNSLEKMLAHQMAAVHRSTMVFAAQFDRRVERLARSNLSYPDIDLKAVEPATRLAGAMARSSLVFQQGLLTLQKIRNGGSQQIVVQHVTVAPGGQAVVAGEMKAGGGGMRRNREGVRKNGR